MFSSQDPYNNIIVSATINIAEQISKKNVSDIVGGYISVINLMMSSELLNKYK